MQPGIKTYARRVNAARTSTRKTLVTTRFAKRNRVKFHAQFVTSTWKSLDNAVGHVFRPAVQFLTKMEF